MRFKFTNFRLSLLFLGFGVIVPQVQTLMAQSSPPTPNVSWGSALSSENIWTGWAPHDSGASAADPALVVGTDRLLTAVESEMGQFWDPWHGDDHIGNNAIPFNAALGPALPQPADGFITSMPQLILDRTCPDGLGNQRDCYILIGRSIRSSDHSAEILITASYWTGPQEYGSWSYTGFDVSQGNTVFPLKLYAGQTKKAIIVSATMSDWNGNRQSSQIWVIPKAGLYPAGGQQPTYVYYANLTNADGSPARGLVPAISYVDSSITYLLNAYDPGNGLANQVSMWEIDTEDTANPKLYRATVTVNAYANPPIAEQAGSDVGITTFGADFTNAVLLANGLWAAQTTGCLPGGDETARSCIAWYQFNGTSVVQQNNYGIPGAHLFFPSIAANSLGDVTIAFNASASYAYVGLYYTGRRGSDPPNTLNDIALLRDGDGCFVRQVGNSNPLSGSTAVALDLSDNTSFFVFGAYAAGTNPDCSANKWGTWLGRVTW